MKTPRMSAPHASAVRVLLLVLLLVCATPSPALAFGTIDTGGQNREHERITRAALACTNERPDCFGPITADYLAGHDREFGAVGAPDSDEMADSAAHCDDADYLDGGYPRTETAALTALTDCVEHLRRRFRDGLDSAAFLLDDRGEVVAGEVAAGPECDPRERDEDRAKCTVLESFGRVLHGVQDFYSHSNWADRADPSRPIGPDNPPGLHRPGPSPLLNLRGPSPLLDLRGPAPLLDLRGPAPVMPAGFTTGCYVLHDQVPGVGACELRITHAALNKDRGLIDPVSGRATEPGTPRGQVASNFADAVAGAIAESRRQWADFRAELRARYGPAHADRMICALTHDDPVRDCQGSPVRRGPAGLLVAGVVVAVVVLLAIGMRRRRVPPPVPF
ncbi:CinY protein [Actinoplanes sp. NPDC023714]|uniref:CinY protein n=1 Tax=Actinoplanes sp. NPDC023714 TaxID=3154322 RepID=UPI0033ECBB51